MYSYFSIPFSANVFHHSLVSLIRWSPDASKLAFIEFDDRKVEWYDLEMFDVGRTPVKSYARVVPISYPKPGTPNPIVTLRIVMVNEIRSRINLLSLKVENHMKTIAIPSFSSALDDLIIADVAWSRESQYLLIKVHNRFQDHEQLYLVDWLALSDNGNFVKPVLVRDSKRENGWFQRVRLAPNLIVLAFPFVYYLIKNYILIAYKLSMVILYVCHLVKSLDQRIY
jgi:hypothetical protein